MKIIKKNLKKQELTVKIENFDDLWIISQLISTNDLIKGKTERKIKIGENTDRNPKVVRKQFFLAIKVEKTELLEAGLKVLGIIVDSPDEIPRGEHHSFNLELNSIITIVKEQWFKYQLEKITDATKSTPQKILLVIFDREEALFAKLKGKGFELIGKIKGNVQKKEKKTCFEKRFQY